MCCTLHFVVCCVSDAVFVQLVCVTLGGCFLSGPVCTAVTAAYQEAQKLRVVITGATGANDIGSQVEMAAHIQCRADFLLSLFPKPDAVSGAVSRKRWQLMSKRALTMSPQPSSDTSCTLRGRATVSPEYTVGTRSRDACQEVVRV